MSYCQQQIEEVCGLKAAGVSHRDISEAVFGKRTMASTVWYILNQHYYVKPEKQEGPRVLAFDIETAPEVVYSWGRWKQNTGPSQVIQRSFMLSYAYKWLGSSEIFADALPYYQEDYEKDSTNDRNIVESLWRILDASDVVIAHNGVAFDLAYINSRFAYHGLGMPSPYKVIDTLKIAKKYFRFPANSLAELCAYFNVGTKLKTDFDLWVGCLNKDPESWKYMVDYNIQDIDSLESVYLKLRPYDKGHPNVGLYYDDDAIRCPITGSTDVVKLESNAYTAMSGFESYRGPTGNIFRTNKKVKKVVTANAQ